MVKTVKKKNNFENIINYLDTYTENITLADGVYVNAKYEDNSIQNIKIDEDDVISFIDVLKKTMDFFMYNIHNIPDEEEQELLEKYLDLVNKSEIYSVNIIAVQDDSYYMFKI